jgi:DNA-binding transcriptional LysR family regulator
MEPIDRFFQAGLKLSHLRQLVLFERLGQIRLVAEKLNLTQPAISKQLSELEAGLNAEVLVRVGNRLFLTPVGEALVKRSKEVFHQLEQARYEVDALTSGVSGKVSLGAVATVMPVLGPEFVSELRKSAPNVGVELFEATSDRLFPLLSSGSLDLVLSRTNPVAADAQQMFDSRVVLKDPFVVSCGRQHPLAVRSIVSPQDLEGVPWILPPREAPTYAALQTWMDAAGLAFPPGCVQSISLPSVEILLSTDNFLALLPSAIVRNTVNRERLTTLGIKAPRVLETVKLFHVRAAHNPVVPLALKAIAAVQARLMRIL